ncbi:hypothetical protein BKI52_35405 [marine bacterium AO1-C]|nr:hypothetical protein BKI52_35405 [marine bacterium AO1-C]
MKLRVIIISFFGGLLWGPLGFSQNQSQEKIAALIIHNHFYQSIKPLKILPSSLSEFTSILANRKIEITLAKNLNKVALYNTVDAFARKAKKNKYTAIMVFYWGYMLEYRNQNYLLPSDFKPSARKKDLIYRSVSINELMAAFRRNKMPHYFFINGESRQKFQVGKLRIGQRDKVRSLNARIVYRQKKSPLNDSKVSLASFLTLFKEKKCLKEVITELRKRRDASGYQVWQKGKVTRDVCLQPDATTAKVDVPLLQQKALKLILNRADTIQFSQALQMIQRALNANPKNKISQLIAAALRPSVYGMVPIRGGEFMMGYALGKKDEKPIHRVKLSDFAIGQYEVTNLAYLVFLARYNTRQKRVADVKIDERFKKELLISDHLLGLAYNVKKQWWEVKDSSRLFHPVMNVSWYGAMKYCAYYGLMLPTEAQWEYAARGASREAFAGSKRLIQVGWFLGNTEAGKTHRVGLLKPNAWGVYDLSGNVYEWCYDTYEDDYYRSLTTKRVNVNPANTKERKIIGIRTPSDPYPKVIRGGSYQSSFVACQVFSRDKELPYELSYPGEKNNYVKKAIGFRVVKLKAKGEK